jgi:ornithine carbamoyltransferase
MAAYDAFISHCGAGCEPDFAVMVKYELEGAGVRCFLDEESLNIGHVHNNAVRDTLKAMEAATFGVVILSPGCFEHEWCVKELQTFVRRENAVLILCSDQSKIENAKKAAIEKKVWTSFETFKLSEKEYVEAVSWSITGKLKLYRLDGSWDVCIHKAKR